MSLSSSSAALTTSSSSIICSFSFCTAALCCLLCSWFSHCFCDLNFFLHTGQYRSCFAASFRALASSSFSISRASHSGASACAQSASTYALAASCRAFFAAERLRSAAAALAFSSLACSAECAMYRLSLLRTNAMSCRTASLNSRASPRLSFLFSSSIRRRTLRF